MGSAPHRYLSSLAPGRDALKNNADQLLTVTDLHACFFKSCQFLYGAYRILGKSMSKYFGAILCTMNHVPHGRPQLLTVEHVLKFKEERARNHLL